MELDVMEIKIHLKCMRRPICVQLSSKQFDNFLVSLSVDKIVNIGKQLYFLASEFSYMEVDCGNN